MQLGPCILNAQYKMMSVGKFNQEEMKGNRNEKETKSKKKEQAWSRGH